VCRYTLKILPFLCRSSIVLHADHSCLQSRIVIFYPIQEKTYSRVFIWELVRDMGATCMHRNVRVSVQLQQYLKRKVRLSSPFPRVHECTLFFNFALCLVSTCVLPNKGEKSSSTVFPALEGFDRVNIQRSSSSFLQLEVYYCGIIRK